MAALVILVNADPDVLWRTDALLSADGHLVAAVSSLAEAKKLLESVTPDVLVADVRLGVYNGLQLAIRSRLDHPNLPVIITNEWPDATFEAEAKRQGAIFVAAPLDNPEFLRIVRKAIAQSRRTQPAIRRWLRKPVPGTMRGIMTYAGKRGSRWPSCLATIEPQLGMMFSSGFGPVG